ncbi:MAG: hypothetical protein MI824_06580 [Hyphomicrobiales bacterium]|nr:hypothetical protein [Hyphomicrobiales bacterium]
MANNTEIEIRGDQFFLNGEATYRGVRWQGRRIEGLLLNTRMVQGIFDDLNPETRGQWAYPDTGAWDADRNTREFVEAMPDWRPHGVLAFTINLQGGSPYGYSKEQPWINSALAPDGALRPDYLARLTRVLDGADALGMAVILGLYYFGQEKVMQDEAAIARGVDNAVDWVLAQGWRNVLIEINNECNVRYRQPCLLPDGVHALIERARSRSRDGRRLLVGTSHGGGFVPQPNVVAASDFLLVHGNHITEPERIRELVRRTREVEGYRPMPILFNEDDHFDFDKPDNNFLAALDAYASWGFFDYRMEGEGFDDGFQSVPVNWRISSPRKRGFFELAKRITAGD